MLALDEGEKLGSCSGFRLGDNGQRQQVRPSFTTVRALKAACYTPDTCEEQFENLVVLGGLGLDSEVSNLPTLNDRTPCSAQVIDDRVLCILGHRIRNIEVDDEAHTRKNQKQYERDLNAKHACNPFAQCPDP